MNNTAEMIAVVVGLVLAIAVAGVVARRRGPRPLEQPAVVRRQLRSLDEERLRREDATREAAADRVVQEARARGHDRPRARRGA